MNGKTTTVFPINLISHKTLTSLMILINLNLNVLKIVHLKHILRNVSAGMDLRWKTINVLLFVLKVEFGIIMEIVSYHAHTTITIPTVKMLVFHAQKTQYMIQIKINASALVDFKLKMDNVFPYAQNIQVMSLNGTNVFVMTVLLTLDMAVEKTVVLK